MSGFQAGVGRLPGGALRRLLDHPIWAVCGSSLVVVFFGLQLLSLETNPSSYMLGASHPVRAFDRELRDIFTATGPSIAVVLEPVSGSVYQPATLRLIQELTARFEDLTLGAEADEGVLRGAAFDAESERLVADILRDGLGRDDRSALEELQSHFAAHGPEDSGVDRDALQRLNGIVDPVLRVTSLSNVEDMRDVDGVLSIERLFDDVPDSDQAIEELRAAVTQNPLVLGVLVSRDARATAIQIELSVSEDDSITVKRTHEAISEILAGVDASHRVSVGGIAVVINSAGEYLEQDNARFFPVVLLAITLVLAFSFRSWQGVYIPLIVATASVVCTLGVLPVLGLRQNVMTTMIPIFVMATAVADGIHVLSYFYRTCATNGHRVREAIEATFSRLFVALSFTSITTAIGFLSLAYTEIVTVREFGLFVAVGVVFAYFFTVTLVPPLLMMGSGRKTRVPVFDGSARMTLAVGAWIRPLSVWVTRSTPRMLAGIVLVAILAAFSARTVEVDFATIGMYPEDSQLRIDDRAIREHFEGMVSLSIRLDGLEHEDMYREPVIRYIERVEAALREQPTVGYVTSSVAYLRRINQVLDGGDQDRLPDPLPPGLAAQYYLLYDSSSGQEIRDVVEPSYRDSRVVALLSSDRASVVRSAAEAAMAVPVPPGIRARVSGPASVTLGTVDAIVYGQINSLVISAVLILGVMSLLFRSVLIGMIAVAPLALSLLINFGVLGAVGLHLDVGTSIIAAIVLGVSVDYSIHFVEAFRSGRREDSTSAEALRAAMVKVGPPIAINSLSLAGGFMVLTLSSFTILQTLGALIGMTMIVSAIAAMVVLPVLFLLLPEARLPRHFQEPASAAS